MNNTSEGRSSIEIQGVDIYGQVPPNNKNQKKNGGGGPGSINKKADIRGSYDNEN